MVSRPGTEMFSRHWLFVAPPRAEYRVLFCVNDSDLYHRVSYFWRIVATSDRPSVIAGAGGCGGGGQESFRGRGTRRRLSHRRRTARCERHGTSWNCLPSWMADG